MRKIEKLDFENLKFKELLNSETDTPENSNQSFMPILK
jgi:hypothetical protein